MRLAVDGDRIVDADAPGMAAAARRADAARGGRRAAARRSRPTRSRTRSRRCSGPSRDPERIAVAMSGGVDSAVALLRAGPKAIGVTLRLWLDPAGPDSERACCSPEAVIAARETCHALGLPHVTLDLREEFRRAVVDPFVAGYARGETPNPCGRCNGEFRFAELLDVRRARRRCPCSGRATTRESSSATAGGCSPAQPTRTKDQSYMLAPLDPALLERIEFPLGEQTKTETRSEAGAAGLEVAERRESQEACFLAGDDYRAFLERRGLEPRGRRDRRRGRRRARPPRRRLALHARPASRDRRRRGRAALRAALGRGHEHARRRAARLARLLDRRGARRPLRPGRATSRRSCATARRRCRRA